MVCEEYLVTVRTKGRIESLSENKKKTIMLVLFYIPHVFDVIDTGLFCMNNGRPYGRATFTRKLYVNLKWKYDW